MEKMNNIKEYRERIAYKALQKLRSMVDSCESQSNLDIVQNYASILEERLLQWKLIGLCTDTKIFELEFDKIKYDLKTKEIDIILGRNRKR